MNKLIILLISGILVTSACKKLETPIPTEPSNPGKVTKFSEIKTNPSFDWSTEKELNIHVTGLKTSSPVRGTLTISTTDGKGIIYSGNHLMEETFSIKSKVAINLKELKVKFGSIEKTYLVAGNNLDVDYVIDYPEVD